jgi:glycosyltransferase 2 family protein
MIRHKRFISLVIIALLIYIVAPQIEGLKKSFGVLHEASIPLVLLAISLTMMTYVFVAEIYATLIKHPVRLRALLLVQAATALTSRLVPIGVGSIGFNLLFLQRRKHTLPEALGVAAAFSAIAVIIHFTLLGIVLISVPMPANVHFSITRQEVTSTALAVAAIMLLLILFRRLRFRIARASKKTLQAIASYRESPKTILSALILSAGLSIIYVLVLLVCSQALGVKLEYNQVFVIYTFSLLTGAATPTPGGLVGVEAGLTGGFVAYGTASSTALAIALLYRLITYWLPLIPGIIALRIVQHRFF